MDRVRNPFAPGAGTKPHELAGRDAIVDDANVALQRILQGRHAKSQILTGLRGTGKTVLLRKIESMATELGYQTAFIESPESTSLGEQLFPAINRTLQALSLVQSAKAHALAGLRALRSFASTIKLSVGPASISVDPEPGIADSGNLDNDLADLFERTSIAARSANAGWVLFIDEIQYLSENELSAVIVAAHRMSQKQLPFMFFGAGLPQIAGLAGNAKSYAERLFDFPIVGPLDVVSAKLALQHPIESEGESIQVGALNAAVKMTKGYPYFLQEWGYQAWNAADASPISQADVQVASREAIKRLDQGFFRVRIDRLTPKEREYVMAMANLGSGPYRSTDVAAALGEPIQSLGPRRASIIAKGMIYSPQHGDIDFTVPMFDEYLMRNSKQTT